MVAFSRSDSLMTMSISASCSCDSASSWRSSCTEPDIAASGLRISWAMPAAISPSEASRCRSWFVRSSAFTAVTSWKVKMTPGRPSGSGSGAAVTPTSIVRPSGRWKA